MKGSWEERILEAEKLKAPHTGPTIGIWVQKEQRNADAWQWSSISRTLAKETWTESGLGARTEEDAPPE